jgi:aryl-alcohol dehydrogenase-like predicted oxidoreductase
MIERRRLGRTGLEVTRIGIGGWQLGGGEWPGPRDPQDDERWVETVRRALETGLDWIDTAPVYGLGHSERIVARALQGLGVRPLLFTKCGYVWDDVGNIRQTLRRDSIRREVEESLRRLEVDAIDLYQIHWPVPDGEIEEGWAALVEVKEEGLVRHIGVSNFDVDQLARCETIAPVETLQPPYSMLEPGVAESILPYCLERDIGVIVYSPQAAGLLSGSMTRDRIASLPPTDDRGELLHWQDPQLTVNLELVERLREIGAPAGWTPGSLAVAWTLANPAVTAAIVGFSRPDQVDGLLVAAEDEQGLQSALRDAELLP